MDIKTLFLRSNRVQVVAELEARLNQLGEALEWKESSEGLGDMYELNY